VSIWFSLIVNFSSEKMIVNIKANQFEVASVPHGVNKIIIIIAAVKSNRIK
jgi:hypothetical protein